MIKSFLRSRILLRVLCTALFALVLFTVTAISSAIYWTPSTEFQKAVRDLDDELQSLIGCKPAIISENEWEFMVNHTVILHRLSSQYRVVSHSVLERLRNELLEKKNGEVSVATIKWLWGEYIAMSPRAVEYAAACPWLFEGH